MKTLFVARGNDEIALRSLEVLSQYGQETRVIEQMSGLPAHSIALFSTEAKVRNKFLRLSRHRMSDEEIAVPAWARSLPFVVAINAESATNDRFGGLRVALRHMADVYGKWGPWMFDSEAPWDPVWKGGQKHPAFDPWLQKARQAADGVSCMERLLHRMQPVFPPRQAGDISKLVVTGCALFNQAHTDVVDVIPRDKQRVVLACLERVIRDSGVRNVQFVIPDEYLLRSELRDHFHPFMFMSVVEAAQMSGNHPFSFARVRGEAHAHARNDGEIGEALRSSADAIRRDIVRPLSERCGFEVRPISWDSYIGGNVERAHALAQKHRAHAEAIYMERVRTRPSYASLHAIDPARGLRRTISNNVFYIGEAMFLKDNPDTAIVNCEFADTFWKGLEPLLASEIWGDFRPLIGMVPEAARQPWGY